MTDNRRIFWNVVATYGRSLYALALGIFTSRWVLMALGKMDFGLWGLIGGLTVFITFFNSVLASANARFYAYSIGALKTAEDRAAALEECRRWFNVAVGVHAVVPLLLIGVGYPLGEYAVRNWLVIPPERVGDCVWVMRFSCITCLVSMVNVPFTAMYAAKQYIAELTLYSFVTTTLNAAFLYWMVLHPGVWLAKYAAWVCAVGALPQAIICCRALRIFPECRVVWRYMFDLDRLRKLSLYCGWQFVGNLCGMLRVQGISVVINKFFGAEVNGAQSLGISVQGHCNSLAGAMQGAFTPVITQACGEGDYAKMARYAFRTCRFNIVLTAIFSIPLILELPEVLRLWLKEPPPYTAAMCFFALLINFASSSSVGHMIAVQATGRIAGYFATLGSVSIFTLPLAAMAGMIWRNVYAVMAVVSVMEVVNALGRLYFARREAGIGIRKWVFGIVLPALAAIGAAFAVGYIPHLFMEESFLRICVTVLLCELVYLPLVWHFVFAEEEKALVREKILSRLAFWR